MRIYRIAAKKFYHGSQNEFPVGFVLLPQTEGYVHQEKHFEDRIEKYRPPNKISRFDAVFMTSNPNNCEPAGGYSDFIYEVVPNGQVDRSDLAWYSEAEIYLEATENEVKECAINYWNGVPFKNPSNSQWEYRARSATIIRVL